MAVSKNNVLTKGASGMLGKTLVFRSWNGKTIIANRPSKPKKQSSLQKETRTKFARAVAFSKRMMADPIKKAEYKAIAEKENLPNAYTAAVTEYMRKPEVLEVQTTEYSEKKPQRIKVVAKKKGFPVAEVAIVILNEKGQVVEEGKAVNIGDEWIFSPGVETDLKFFQILIKAIDRVGNLVNFKVN